MLEYDTIFNDSFKKNRDSLDQNTVQHLSNFHSSLGNRVNKDKVGLWKKEISEKDQNLIWWMCHKTAIKLGYTADGCVTKHYFNTKMMFEAVKFLLLIRIYSYTYFKLPFSIKYLIKKVRYGRVANNHQYMSSKHFRKVTKKVNSQ